MRLLRYESFTNDFKLNENLDGAKKLLKNTYKEFKIVKEIAPDEYKTDPSGLFLFNKEGDVVNFNELPSNIKDEVKKKFREVKVTPEENVEVEKGPILKQVRDLLGDKLGYAHLFTYLLIVERTPIGDLKSILTKLIDYKDLLNSKNLSDNQPLLRRPIANYIDPNVPNNAEQLIDDLDGVEVYRGVRRIISQFTPNIKRDFDNQPPAIKKQLEELALAFSNLGRGEDGEIDEEENLKLWKLFFGEIRVLGEDIIIRGESYKKGDKIFSGQMNRFENVRDFIRSAKNFISSCENDQTVNFYKSIDKCNDKYGEFGVKVMFDEGNILILDVLSFQANQMLNSHTRHCIKDNIGQWNSYVGGDQDRKFNKQYYIYNFNLPSTDQLSVIGATIDHNGRITAAHRKDDGGVSSDFMKILKRWEKEYSIDKDLFSYFKPMTPEEVSKKERRIMSNREVVKPNLPLETLKKLLVEDGADVNAGKGAPLDNAVSEGNIEKVKYLLEFGALPNLRDKGDYGGVGSPTIDKVQNLENSVLAFDIVKLLVRYGSQLTGKVFKAMVYDYDAVKFCLDNGFDPNFSTNLPVRIAIKRGYFETLKLLIEYGGVVDNKGMNLSWAYEARNKEIVEYLINKGVNDYDKAMQWVTLSGVFSDDEKVDILDEMQSFIDDGRVTTKSIRSSGYTIRKDGTVNRNATYDDVVKSYGSLSNYFIEMSGLKRK